MSNQASFFDAAGDRRMETQNIPRWQAITAVVMENLLRGDVRWDNKTLTILDIGCHTGGMLSLMASELDASYHNVNLWGVEPLAGPRAKACARLPTATLFSRLEGVESNSVDVVVSHEALYLVEGLKEWCRELKRVLKPGAGAFVALGSHGENTAWLRWRKQLLELYGHVSYVHQPMDILKEGEAAGFDMELARLHPEPSGSIRYCPPEDGWGDFVSAEEMLKSRWQKLLFTFYPK